MLVYRVIFEQLAPFDQKGLPLPLPKSICPFFGVPSEQPWTQDLLGPALVSCSLQPKAKRVRLGLFGFVRLQITTDLRKHLVEAKGVPSAKLRLGVALVQQAADAFFGHHVPLKGEERAGNVRLILLKGQSVRDCSALSHVKNI